MAGDDSGLMLETIDAPAPLSGDVAASHAGGGGTLAEWAAGELHRIPERREPIDVGADGAVIQAGPVAAESGESPPSLIPDDDF